MGARLERSNRLRTLAAVFESSWLSSKVGLSRRRIRRAADWLDPTVARRLDEVDEPRGDQMHRHPTRRSVRQSAAMWTPDMSE